MVILINHNQIKVFKTWFQPFFSKYWMLKQNNKASMPQFLKRGIFSLFHPGQKGKIAHIPKFYLDICTQTVIFQRDTSEFGKLRFQCAKKIASRGAPARMALDTEMPG